MAEDHGLPEGPLMRVVAFILSTVIATGLLIEGALFLTVNSDVEEPVWLFTVSVAMTTFIYGPLVLGSFRAYGEVAGSVARRSRGATYAVQCPAVPPSPRDAFESAEAPLTRGQQGAVTR